MTANDFGLPRNEIYTMMDVFFEVKPIVRILYFLTFFATFQATVAVELIDCIKSDECSCKTNTKPQQQISLWPMPGRNGTFGTHNWRYDINLCHGFDKNVNSKFRGCRNATVCQYDPSNKDMTFEIGQFGNATFGQYNNETKSISLKYYGVLQSGSTRSISITLNCDENGNITHPDYEEIFPSALDLNDFVTTIKTKAACLRPVTIPTSRSHVASSGGGGLKTVYIVFIAVSGFVVVIAIGSYVVYKINKRQNRGLINKEEENQDYGTVPQVQVQNAALFTPVSGPI